MVFRSGKFLHTVFRVYQTGGYLLVDIPKGPLLNPFFKKYYLTRISLFPLIHRIFPKIIHKKKIKKSYNLNLTKLSKVNKEINFIYKAYSKFEIPIKIKAVNLNPFLIQKEIIAKFDQSKSLFILNELLTG